jgi:hypothetical protein
MQTAVLRPLTKHADDLRNVIRGKRHRHKVEDVTETSARIADLVEVAGIGLQVVHLHLRGKNKPHQKKSAGQRSMEIIHVE